MDNTDNCNVKVCFLKLLEVLQNIKKEKDVNNVSINLDKDDSDKDCLSLKIGLEKPIKLTENNINRLEDNITDFNNLQQNNKKEEEQIVEEEPIVEEKQQETVEKQQETVEKQQEVKEEEQVQEEVKEEQEALNVEQKVEEEQVEVEEEQKKQKEEQNNDVTTTFDPNLTENKNEFQNGGGSTSDIFINRYQANERYLSSREEQRGGNVNTTMNSITELRERSSLNLNLLRKHQKGGRINNYGINSTSTSSVCD